MVNALTLNQSLATNDVTVMRTTSHPLRAMVARWVDENQNAIQQKKKKKNRSEIRHKQHSKSYLDPVIIKLDNVIAKYEVKKSILEDLYMGVVGCGVSRCEKFRDLIPENQRIRRLRCFKKQNGFKNMISDLLSSFHRGVQRLDKSFQALINFEKWPHLNNASRRRILEEFKIDVKTLNVEIETVLTNKRLNLARETDSSILSKIQRPENQTHLMIYEWRIIQASKKFLRDWKRNLNKVLRCWKRRRQRKMKMEKELHSASAVSPETINSSSPQRTGNSNGNR